MIKFELDKKEYKFLTDLLSRQIEKLCQMTSVERIAWYNNALYREPINFTRQIDNTIYTVNTHFNVNSNESIKDKIVHI
ncbi:MAG: transposon-encoded TnpW family protein, partial [Clostridium sp.]|nr:transposon-encoded TnpW family protein [Clostridium sp.]